MNDWEPELNLHGRAWVAFAIGPQRDKPSLQQPERPLEKSRLALVTTGGFVPPGGKPFNTGKFGDPSFREIPVDVEPGELQIHHPHYDHDPARRDINVIFPIPLCRKLVDEGVLGDLAAVHYSFMGYVPLTRKLERRYAPQVARQLERAAVDAVLLTPA